MSEGTLNPSNAEESAYVRNQLIAFNAAHLSEDLKHRYEELNFNIKNEAGKSLPASSARCAGTGWNSIFSGWMRSSGTKATVPNCCSRLNVLHVRKAVILLC